MLLDGNECRVSKLAFHDLDASFLAFLVLAASTIIWTNFDSVAHLARKERDLRVVDFGIDLM
jgi:hypothetical protein